MPRARPIAARQRGVAIITALLLVMVAASVAAWLIARETQALTRTLRANDRAAAALLAAPVLDYVRAELAATLKPGKPIGLDQPWARGLSGLPVEGASAAGRLVDQGGRFNLNNLIQANGARSEPDVAAFRRLLGALSLDPALADRAADWIDGDDEASGAGGMENAQYFAADPPRRAANRALVDVAELARAKGFDEAALGRLKPFVTALPERTSLNLNTAPEEVLLAYLPMLSPDSLTALVRARQAAAFDKLDGAGGPIDKFKEVPAASWKAIGTESRWFVAEIAIAQGEAQVLRRALLKRVNKGGAEGWPAIIWVAPES